MTVTSVHFFQRSPFPLVAVHLSRPVSSLTRGRARRERALSPRRRVKRGREGADEGNSGGRPRSGHRYYQRCR